MITGIAAWLAMIVSIWKLFELADTALSEDAKDMLGRWLANVDLAGVASKWPAAFVRMFDHVFGARHLSWRCLGRSCVASLTAVVVLFLVWGTLHRIEFGAFAGRLIHPDWQELLALAILTVGWNVFPDYLSLLETRLVLRWMTSVQGSLGRILLLVVDGAATLAIAVAGFLLMVLIGCTVNAVLGDGEAVSACVENQIRSIPVILPKVLGLDPGGKGSPSLGIWFYSAFLTSVWLWLYLAAGLIVKLAHYLQIGVGGIRRLLDIEKRPCTALGWVAVAVVSLIWWSAVLVRWLRASSVW